MTLTVIEQKEVAFYADQITAVLVENADGERVVYVPLRPICDLLGVAWSPQRRRINRDAVLSTKTISVTVTVTHIDQSSKARKTQKQVCLPLDYLSDWLFGINLARLKPLSRERLAIARKELASTIGHVFGVLMPVLPQSSNMDVAEKSAFVYLIAAIEGNGTRHHKIGYTTTKPEKYAVSLSRRSPLPLLLTHYVHTTETKGRLLEKSLHKRYSAEKTHHEWFSLAPEQVREIQAL